MTGECNEEKLTAGERNRNSSQSFADKGKGNDEELTISKGKSNAEQSMAGEGKSNDPPATTKKPAVRKKYSLRYRATVEDCDS